MPGESKALCQDPVTAQKVMSVFTSRVRGSQRTMTLPKPHRTAFGTRLNY